MKYLSEKNVISCEIFTKESRENATTVFQKEHSRNLVKPPEINSLSANPIKWSNTL